MRIEKFGACAWVGTGPKLWFYPFSDRAETVIARDVRQRCIAEYRYFRACDLGHLYCDLNGFWRGAGLAWKLQRELKQ